MSKLFPELERLPTKKARREAWSIAKRTVSTSWRYWAAIAGIVAPSAVLQFSLRRLGIPMAWRGPFRGLVVAITVILCWAILLAFRKTIRRTLWRLLLDHGIPCCTSCGYDLTGNESGICPECGEPVECLA
jgi:Na+/melibiose symporter-like transporter